MMPKCANPLIDERSSFKFDQLNKSFLILEYTQKSYYIH